MPAHCISIAMNKKKTFALRVDADLLAAIEKWASDEFRSTNGQLEWIIHRALKEAKRLKKDADGPQQA